MPGTILSAVSRKRIAKCYLRSAQLSTCREALIEIYKAARISLVGGKLFDEVCTGLAKRADELGVNKKGGKFNA